jgi:hypothetical protein
MTSCQRGIPNEVVASEAKKQAFVCQWARQEQETAGEETEDLSCNLKEKRTTPDKERKILGTEDFAPFDSATLIVQLWSGNHRSIFGISLSLSLLLSVSVSPSPSSLWRSKERERFTLSSE